MELLFQKTRQQTKITVHLEVDYQSLCSWFYFRARSLWCYLSICQPAYQSDPIVPHNNRTGRGVLVILSQQT